MGTSEATLHAWQAATTLSFDLVEAASAAQAPATRLANEWLQAATETAQLGADGFKAVGETLTAAPIKVEAATSPEAVAKSGGKALDALTKAAQQASESAIAIQQRWLKVAQVAVEEATNLQEPQRRLVERALVHGQELTQAWFELWSASAQGWQQPAATKDWFELWSASAQHAWPQPAAGKAKK